jgi:hypothetical protein
VKDLSARWAVTILLAPVLLILGLAFLGGPDQASAKAPPAGKATVAVAFISSFANSSTITSFQRIGLNVITVRLNPSTDPNVSEFDGKWVSIDVPPGVGRNSGVSAVSTGNNFGGNLSNTNSSVLIGQGKSEIQIDLNAIQNIAEIFNAQAIPAKTYRQLELVLDAATPGNVVPVCAGATSGEGCISYRAKFPVVTPTPITPMSIRTSFPGNGLDLSKSQNIVTPVVIQIDPGLQAGPTTFNQTVTINPTITIPSTTPPLPGLATLLGTITTTASAGFSGTRPQAITAELAGTNNIVEKILLPKSCNGKKTCNFTMYLPAVDATVGGTNYDLFASAINTTYSVRSNVNVAAETTTDLTGTPFTVATQKTISLSGKVTDACADLGVQAATLNLLVAEPVASPSPTPDCTLNPPTGCVVVATASSDEVGNFPLPGNGLNKAPFNLVPPPDAATKATYELVTTAAGFDRTLQTVTAKSGSLKCSTSVKGACNFTMNHGQVTGNVSLAGGGTGPLTIAVMAEDSGTNNIENLALVNIPTGATTAPFTMNVPDADNIGLNNVKIANLDLFAAAQDLFNGAPQTDTGHTIAVDSVVPAPPAPMGTPVACATPVVAPDLNGITCVGHGSVSGIVTGPKSGDTVVLSLGGVDLQTVPVIPPVAPAAGNYAICAPADPAAYTLQHVNSAGTTIGSPTSVTMVPPVLVPTPVPSPGVTPVPCPAICPNAVPNQNTGCLTCSGQTANF